MGGEEKAAHTRHQTPRHATTCGPAHHPKMNTTIHRLPLPETTLSLRWWKYCDHPSNTECYRTLQSVSFLITLEHTCHQRRTCPPLLSYSDLCVVDRARKNKLKWKENKRGGGHTIKEWICRITPWQLCKYTHENKQKKKRTDVEQLENADTYCFFSFFPLNSNRGMHMLY